MQFSSISNIIRLLLIDIIILFLNDELVSSTQQLILLTAFISSISFV